MSRTSWSFSKLGLLTLWVLGATMIRRGGTQPGYYDYSSQVDSSYPLLPVFLFPLVELLAVWLILRPATYQRSWGRSAAALSLFAPWAFFCIGFVMHGPGYHAAHAIWVLALVVVLAITFLVSSAAALSHALRARAPEGAA